MYCQRYTKIHIYTPYENVHKESTNKNEVKHLVILPFLLVVLSGELEVAANSSKAR